MSTLQIPKWNIKADYVETCNCDYGCPRNFNGFPTYGFCRALVLFHITSGIYGSVKLDGIDVIYAGSWPKAIHEGNGTMQLFITEKATEEQRKAIVDIFSGKAKDEGPFALCKYDQVLARFAVCGYCSQDRWQEEQLLSPGSN
ncbi:MAG TPA: DUF1326 domain-containing protein [Nitrososphaera sp.]|nr:DUF1326 domain-containing protein [Nitrososphaera sp.]